MCGLTSTELNVQFSPAFQLVLGDVVHNDLVVRHALVLGAVPEHSFVGVELAVFEGSDEDLGVLGLGILCRPAEAFFQLAVDEKACTLVRC